MTRLRDLLDGEELGLTVYSPDCAQSRLWGNLDHAIATATGFRVLCRRWVYHDINSIARFYHGPDDEEAAEREPAGALQKYEAIPPETLQYGHLVVRLFLMGPSLLTLWRGPQAIPTLLKARGASHPAAADPESIRGRFWCDSAVCNLMHASDEPAEVRRELAALRLDSLLDDEAGSDLPLMPPLPQAAIYPAHSGIVVLCDVLNRAGAGLANGPRLLVRLSESGEARDTNEALSELLRAAAATTAPGDLKRLITAFLDGDVVTLSSLLPMSPSTPWERFVLLCGAINRPEWNAAATP